MRAGIDLGGTKTEIIVLDNGLEVYRQRQATPADDYPSLLQSLVRLFHQAKMDLQQTHLSLGLGMPGALTPDGRIKNANTHCLNGQYLQRDLQALLNQPVALMNDANLFALSEAVDGAGQTLDSVFGVILGTGVGGGWVFKQSIVLGANSIAGEWGHNEMPARCLRASPNKRSCYCGKVDCIETFLSGAGLRQSYIELAGESASVEAIVDCAAQGQREAIKALALYSQQLAAALSMVVNIVDPDVIVLGGGLSNIPQLAEQTEKQLGNYVFSEAVITPVRKNRHGDSSGVRGAAWL